MRFNQLYTIPFRNARSILNKPIMNKYDAIFKLWITVYLKVIMNPTNLSQQRDFLIWNMVSQITMVTVEITQVYLAPEPKGLIS